MREKPPIIDPSNIVQNWNYTAHRKAQRDADVEWYRTHWAKEEIGAVTHGTAASRVMQDIAVNEARQDTAREIHDFLQMHLYARPDKPTATMKFTDWVKLRELFAKYGVK